jgi:hypothetical protein
VRNIVYQLFFESFELKTVRQGVKNQTVLRSNWWAELTQQAKFLILPAL